MRTENAGEMTNKSGTRQLLDAVIDFTGGVAGGTASVYVGQPLDTVKVKMQTFPHLYNNGYKCFVTTLRQDGIARGLYAGTVPSLAAQVSENAVLFMAYGVCQKVVATAVGQSDIKDLSALHNAVSGSMAAFFAALVLCPTELIKCKLQAMREMKDMASRGGVGGAAAAGGAAGSAASSAPAAGHIGPVALTNQILREEGIRGMFRGLVPTFAREMPGYFFFFGGYEVSRSLLTPPGKTKDDLGPLRTVICGGVGGVALWTSIFPTDVIKSRVQIQSGKTGSNQSFIGMLLKIRREEGIRALYKGLGPTILRTFPATGALFLAYETTKKIFGELADKSGI